MLVRLRALPQWPRDRRFIGRLKAHDKQLYDAAYNHFQGASHDLGMGRVQAALWLAGVEVPSGAERGTTLDEDLRAFAQILTGDRRLTESSLRGHERTLCSRLKKRAGRALSERFRTDVPGSMKAVAYLLWERDRSLDVTRCFDHLPIGLYAGLPRIPEPRWYWDGDFHQHVVDLLGEMHAAGVARQEFLPEPFSRLSAGARIFLNRVNSWGHRNGSNWGDLVEEALGAYSADPRGRAGAARHGSVLHARALPRDLDIHCPLPVPGAHKRLRSQAEVIVDGCLAALIGPERYEALHAHDVPLQRLVRSFDSARFEVDIVLVRRRRLKSRGPSVVAVEVRNGTPDLRYEKSLKKKLAALGDAGIPHEVVDFSDLQRERTGFWRQLARILRHAGLRRCCEFERAYEQASRALGVPHGMLSYEDARALVRAKGVTTHAEYRRLRRSAEGTGLPSHPQFTYRGLGWSNWAEFVGVRFGPGRRKGKRYGRFLSFVEARRLVRGTKLRSRKAYTERYRELAGGPQRLPSNPEKIYANEGWKSWSDFLGTPIRIGRPRAR